MVKIKPHGNAKNHSLEYYRTLYTTMKGLQESSMSDPQKTAFFTISNKREQF